jgi:hypothetical protein
MKSRQTLSTPVAGSSKLVWHSVSILILMSSVLTTQPSHEARELRLAPCWRGCRARPWTNRPLLDIWSNSVQRLRGGRGAGRRTKPDPVPKKFWKKGYSPTWDYLKIRKGPDDPESKNDATRAVRVDPLNVWCNGPQRIDYAPGQTVGRDLPYELSHFKSSLLFHPDTMEPLNLERLFNMEDKWAEWRWDPRDIDPEVREVSFAPRETSTSPLPSFRFKHTNPYHVPCTRSDRKRRHRQWRSPQSMLGCGNIFGSESKRVKPLVPWPPESPWSGSRGSLFLQR